MHWLAWTITPGNIYKEPSCPHLGLADDGAVDEEKGL